jgi:antitoxin component YwqK of YwqJK toxin-antitoxin module
VEKCYYKKGKLNGPFLKFFNNGVVAYRGFYKNGFPFGKWVWYNSDGTINSSGIN